MTRAIRVLVIEDHPAVRHGLRAVLEWNGMEVCGEADSLASALQEAAACGPDLAMVDLSLDQENGLDLLRQLADRHPAVALLVYSMYEDAAHVRLALRAGAHGYLTKREPTTLLVQAIRHCLAGEKTYLSPRIRQKLAETMELEEAAGTLSQKEQEVYDLLSLGLPTSAIAARMGLKPRTVETYYRRILVKLDLPGMQELRRSCLTDREAGHHQGS
jgi:DNA-binding NarL/FixJ family response regulator